jgi:hypoxanthine phosphoribosyltransferase
MQIFGNEIREIITEEEITKRVKEIADSLSVKFADEIPILIGVLNGSFIFMADLMRKMSIDCEMDFIKISSYSGKESVGTVKLLKDISADITNRHVIIVEDIIDSGLTIKFLKERLLGAGPKSVTVVALLLKPEIADIDYKIDFVGFEIPPDFVVGYGLDFNQKLRHLSSIYCLEG